MARLAALLLSATAAWAGAAEGRAALDKKDYATALKEFTAAAEAGDAEAHYQVGEIHRRGLGVRANPRLAVKSFEAGAALGHKGAAGELGIHLWKSKKRDLVVIQLREGADGGHMRSQYWLAMLDHKGAMEVDLTDGRRHELFLKAAEQKAPLGGEYLAQHFLALANLKFERYAESYAWAKVGSTTKNAWPVTSKIIQKLYENYAKSLKDLVKGAKKYTPPDQIKQGKALAKEYTQQIKATLKAGRPWEEPDV
ncbi:MAG: hypothetical protein OER88_05515 [Planctomycetota bacterium]|nr:hypothetical protein [Planctomycetota bacterium]